MKVPRVSVRWLLAAVTILASLMFVISVMSFTRLMNLSSATRLERARDIVQRELALVVTDSTPLTGPPRLTVLGLRGGVRADDEPIRSGLSRDVDRAVETHAQVAASDHAEIASLDIDGTTVFIGAQRRPDGRIVWVAYPVSVPKRVSEWWLMISSLTLATVLLGAIAIVAVVGTTRGARALKRSLAALEEDLSAEVPRPALAELASVADGVASLARSLAEAQLEREELAAELRHQERHAALGRVVAGVAHEVRNPLTSMKLRVAVARSTDRVPFEVVAELDAIDEEIGRLDRLVTDFLVVSGRRIGRRVDSDIGELAQKRVVQLTPWAKELGVSLVAEGSARAFVDCDAYARAIDNLVKNAVEASPSGSEVRVKVESRLGVAAMTVEDHGAGVPGEHVHELFEPFFTTKPDGTGLGLAVLRAIAVASGGQLHYQRADGVTRFELALTASQAADDAIRSTRSATESLA